MPTLYRKYRPQTFSSVSGQEHIIQTITNEISSGHIAHAYLFSGPRGTGKTTVARLLAKAVNCLDKKTDGFEPCDICSSCREISDGKNIDVIEIDAASQTGVDNVRENIIENAQFKPTKSKYKVFIIDEVHMLSTSAFNALLKTLEEPPAHVIFILATTELHKLPATVISRCQRFNFKKIPADLMEKTLQKICLEEQVEVDGSVIKKIIGKSEGCLRDAESLLGQILTLNLKKITAEDAKLILPDSNFDETITYLEYIADKNPASAIEILNNIVNSGGNILNFSEDLITTVRIIMLSEISGEINDSNIEESSVKRIKKIAAALGRQEIIRLIDLTTKRINEIKYSPLPQLPLEILAVEFSTENKIEEVEKKTVKIEPKNETKKTIEIKPAGIAKKTESVPAAKTATATTADKRAGKVTLEEISNKWAEIVEKLSTSNHSLVFILKMCTLESLTDHGLNIQVAYTLHKDKIDEAKSKKAIEQSMAEVMGEEILLNCEVIASQTNQNEENNQDLAGLAADFGGEVIG